MVLAPTFLSDPIPRASMKTVTLSKNEALRLAAQALKRWADYGDEMRKIGRGADCSFLAAGIPAHDLVSLIEESTKQD